jgi:hypothetical protein
LAFLWSVRVKFPSRIDRAQARFSSQLAEGLTIKAAGPDSVVSGS